MENKNEPIIYDYDFNSIDTIKAGWVRMEGVKIQFIIGIAIYVTIAIVLQLLLGLIFPQGTVVSPNYLNQQIVGILSYPILMPLMAGIIMMAIEHVRGKNIDFKSIFNYYHLTGKLALAGILIYSITIVGFLLLILPAIYVSVAYVFALPLIVDKNMEVWEAMEYSRKRVTKHWFKVAGLMGFLSIILFVGAIPLGIGFIWTVPLMFVTLYGLIYPIIFDEK